MRGKRNALLPIARRYQALLAEVDGWFAGCQARSGAAVRCGPGCADCCRGLFDITLLDAFLLQQGLARLPAAVQKRVRERARTRLAELQVAWPAFGPPFVLNTMADEHWTEMPEDDPTPCPLLGDDGRCLVYAWRPMICRTHGLPNLDYSGECFSDLCCTLNFSDGDPMLIAHLRWHFRTVFQKELALFREFTQAWLGQPRNELDTFIPTALLIDFTRPPAPGQLPNP